MKVNNEFLDSLSQDRCNAIARHLLIDVPDGRWHGPARTVIIRVMRGWCPFPQGDEREVDWDPDRKLSVRLKEAYPFGEREHYPYTAWRAQMKIMRDVALHITGAFTQEMREIIAVARDAEEQATEKSLALATFMIGAIDYPLLFLKCGVCGKVGAEKPCINLDTKKEMIVPHETRLPVEITQPADSDLPLFGAPL